MLNKHIIGELFEIAQDYKGSSLEFKPVGSKSNGIELRIGNKKLMILHTSNSTYYSIVVKDDIYTHLNLLTKTQALELLYFLKETYDNCKEYPNAFYNALKQMCYKYKKEMEMNKKC